MTVLNPGVCDEVFRLVRGRVEGALVLDLFAREGELGFRALRNGARRVTFVDTDPYRIRRIAAAAEDLGVEEQTKACCLDVVEQFASLESAAECGLIFFVPPRALVHDRPEAVFRSALELGRVPLGRPGAILVAVIPSLYDGPVPFPGARRVWLGPSTVLVVERSQLPSAYQV